MCGIVGYVGGKQAQPILMKALARLEYRGYDSSGIAVSGAYRQVCKDKLRVEELQKKAPVFQGKGRRRPHPLGDTRRTQSDECASALRLHG